MLNLLKSHLTFLLLITASPLALAASYYINPNYITPGNVRVHATADVTYDPNTGLYTYSYVFRNDPTSLLEVSDIMIPLHGSAAINVKAPKGWTIHPWRDGMWGQQGVLVWAATGGPYLIPPNYVDDGTIYPSVHQIKQGQTLGGFSFQSPDPPALVNFYAEGFTQIPKMGVDVNDEYEEQDIPLPSPFDPTESYKGQTKGPQYTESLYTGNRRPATDGFLVFKNLVNRDTKVAPVQVDIEFGINGETVDQATFKATLNSKDVTAHFKSTGPKTMRAVFQPAQLNTDGRNTLLTTVHGIIPRNGRTAGDVDRVVFTVQP